MSSPEEFIASLFHSDPDYDPAARRAYYLRTRQLKGRRVGNSKTAIARHPSSRNGSNIRPGLLKPSHPSAKKNSAKQHRKEVEAKVAHLEQRLDKLRRILAELVRQAKLRSGVETKRDSVRDEKPEKLTTRQKADAAERAKKSRDKNKEPSLSDQAQALQTKIKSVKAKIKQMREQLAEAKARKAKKRKTVPVGVGKKTLPRKENSRDGR